MAIVYDAYYAGSALLQEMCQQVLYLFTRYGLRVLKPGVLVPWLPRTRGVREAKGRGEG
jgi:hypothetical protein